MNPRRNDKRRASIYIRGAFWRRRMREIADAACRWSAASASLSMGNPWAVALGAITGAVATHALTRANWRRVA